MFCFVLFPTDYDNKHFLLFSLGLVDSANTMLGGPPEPNRTCKFSCKAVDMLVNCECLN